MRRDGERELRPGEQNAAAFFIRKLQVLLELGERGDAVFQLPFPIVPELRRNVRPIARRVRDELFSIHFARGKSEHFSFVERKVNGLNNRVNAGTSRCASTISCLLLLLVLLLLLLIRLPRSSWRRSRAGSRSRAGEGRNLALLAFEQLP